MDLTGSRIARIALLVGLPLVSACNEATAPDLGRVIVSVTEANNAGAALIPTDLLLATTRQLWRATRTTTDGSAEFGATEGGVIPQDYIVTIDLIGTRYELANGETEEKPVTVVSGQTYTISFKVVKAAGAGS